MAIAFKLLLPLQIAQAVFAIIVLGLSAYVANWWSGFWRAHSPDEVRYIVFCSVWTLLALVYLVLAPLKFPGFAHIFAILAIELLTMIFWFAGFIALAVFLGDRLCYGDVCSAAKAADVFAAFEWALFAVTAVLATLEALSARRNSSSTSNKGRNATVEVHNTV